MQVRTLLQADNHASTPPLSFFTGRMLFLLPNQPRQSTEGNFLQAFTSIQQLQPQLSSFHSAFLTYKKYIQGGKE